ncbi:glutathione S-transferase family protein [Massilia sp. Dwa41.01b]|uniref:glutathione S-transferase family protein n=1 Tax=unclassified Massilia TaxID=2609279 RepID=UPI0016001FC1|nr:MULTISPECIES: glutathione S-transferase family protein [unclassified Massilia]QNA87537.1 glutathione S-transferase family protein [Massilia sp. Dwa41.01b]QNA98444.1 glutathione S-transferase family protein [Massilia sp. Se16.2.3]
MITLYHCIAARSFRVLWTLEELGLPYGLNMLPFPPRVHDRAYLEINPLGTVPAFFDGELRMTESAAICHYLAERYGPASMTVAREEPDYGPFLNWLHFGEATLTFPQTLILRYARFEPPGRRNAQVAEDYTRWFLSRLRNLEAPLSTQDYLCMGRFTVADISVGYALLLAEYLGLRPQFSAVVDRYLERLKARPAFARACAAEREAAAAQGVSLTPAPAMPTQAP